MVGITSFGAYVPYYRLDRGEIARAWGGASLGGERAVANWDEDSISMAVEAAADCARGGNRESIDGLFFASTSSPFREKQAATLISTAVDLRPDMITLDSLGTLRSGTIALRAAADAVKAGSARQVLVTAADCRLGSPQSLLEQRLGDGAAALLVGDSNVVATIEGSYSICNEITDVWRREEDTFVHSWEDRFVLSQGYQRILPQAISETLKIYNLAPKDFAKVVLYAPDARSQAAVVGALGFDARSQVQELPFDTVGNTGAAFSLMSLVMALEEAKPGEKILLASYGDGCDVFILQVTPEIEKVRNRRGMKGHIASKGLLSNYEQYLIFRGIVPVEPSRVPNIVPPATTLWRERNSLLRFHGTKCGNCGEVQYPIQRICGNCRAKDNFSEIRLSDIEGSVFSFTLDTGTQTHDLSTIWAIVDMDEGCKVRLLATDAQLEDIAVGMRMEMTFRKFPREGDVPVYSWKCRRVR